MSSQKAVKCIIVVGAFVMGSVVASAQSKTVAEDTAYTKVINQRAEKIVKTLSLASPEQALRVRNIIADQYRNINSITDAHDVKLKSINAQSGEQKQTLKTDIENKTNTRLDSLGKVFVSQLDVELDESQIEQIKNGLTYNVLPITYKGYQEMIPNLTEAQKKQILAYLIEAREHAMTAGSSDKKHWWFGKYKGRINNYLSSEGYDLKKEGDAWEKRRKESGKS